MSKKKLLLILSFIIAVTVTAVILVLVVFVSHRNRIVRITDVQGDAAMTRDDIGKIEPYKNMKILSGDRMVLNNGVLTLGVDSNKHVYFDERTELTIDYSGTVVESDTEIELERGAITCDFSKRISSDSSFQITTPNAVLTTKGTLFRAEVYEEDVVRYTRVSVFEGSVVAVVLNKDGTETEETVTVEAGTELLIYEDENQTRFVSEPKNIDYTRVPAPVLKVMKKAAKSKRRLAISKDEIDKYLDELATVTFKYNGNKYSVKTVTKGTVLEDIPLDPSVTGAWDYDFTKPIKEDLVVEWK